MNYYRHIDRSKIQFDFLYFQELPEDHKEEIANLGGRFFSFGKPSFSSGYQNKLKRFFEEHIGEYSAVHCHPIWAAEVVAKQAKRVGIKHVIAHAHSTKFSNKPISAIRNKLMMVFMRCFATDFVACSSDAAELFSIAGVKKEKVVVVNNAIDVDCYSYDDGKRQRIRNDLSIPTDAIVLGTVGRMSVEKNQLFLLEVFAEFVKSHPEGRLLIVGDGNMRNDIERKIDELGLQQTVILAGKRKDIQGFLSAMDLFLLPSLFEGVPVSVVEAQANGLLCVLSSAITKSVGLNRGFYCDLNSGATGWANSIRDVLNKADGNDRNDHEGVIVGGFDIFTESKELEAYYDKMSR